MSSVTLSVAVHKNERIEDSSSIRQNKRPKNLFLEPKPIKLPFWIIWIFVAICHPPVYMSVRPPVFIYAQTISPQPQFCDPSSTKLRLLLISPPLRVKIRRLTGAIQNLDSSVNLTPLCATPTAMFAEFLLALRCLAVKGRQTKGLRAYK
ncbi:hypothetical protein AVEN_12787-1 [Araneus ventricosus]|uniref:Uncharacterized protein n=1 Tax=Araneus ventricosus TaxID=182803 RepID=A0A4Y2ABU5_ARAVE|nr:hypothetical protein AVEN_12787-1 [Araneus ventricosus]